VSALGNATPVVSNIRVSQRADESKLVDIWYDLADADGDACTIWVAISGDNGVTWSVPALTLVGHIGANMTAGTNKHVVWDAGADMPGKRGTYRARVLASDGKGLGPMVMVAAGAFPYQNNTSKPVHCDAFMIDKFEVTNLFYCQFLNDADPAGDHWYNGDWEIRRHGNAGSYTYSVAPGKENYPVRYVSAYDAEAFAAWRSSIEGGTFRLPTEQEWEKAAGWDPVEQKMYTYGYHSNSIDQTWCNYNNYYGGPTLVGYFNGTDPRKDAKSYYGCYDMSGNVWEWTSSIYSGTSRVVRGGDWDDIASICQASSRLYYTPSSRNKGIGFRLVLDLE